MIVSFRHKTTTFNNHRPAPRESTGESKLTSRVHRSHPHTDSSALISQRHQVGEIHLINSGLQNSFANICSLVENNINVENLF